MGMLQKLLTESLKMQLKNAKLRCDNKKCGYEMKIDFKDAKKYINYPCPKCNSNMLTEDSYKSIEQLLNTCELLGITLSEEEIKTNHKVNMQIKTTNDGKTKTYVKKQNN